MLRFLRFRFTISNTVDATQKCIDVLCLHHNLYPTFAKVKPFLPSCPLFHLILPQPSFPSFPTVIPLYLQTPLAPLFFYQQQAHKIARSPPHQHNEPAPVRHRLRPRTRAHAFYLVSASWPWLVDFDFVYWDGDGYWWRFPMNINVPTLCVLIAPHVIRGSRFFADTRLQLPQLVAYIQCAFPSFSPL
ncbi:hypothetical protein M422DRAFT_260422 [Sphaerobolus stellatus SS14]|uniref:Uncharacterized protein n=1 Tax=Sphaerobolus stellatus (strain SS14) TaxID=990650 RepID=A0A0C9U2J7_SPHS4|nr:hypothetical protein M422DRAFT_260422 [Sphaerobolus stellatus SS14]